MMHAIFSENRNLRICARTFSFLICALTAGWHGLRVAAGQHDAPTLIALSDTAVFGLFFLVDAALLIRGHRRKGPLVRGLVVLNAGALVLLLSGANHWLGLVPGPVLWGLCYPAGAALAGLGAALVVRTPDRAPSLRQKVVRIVRRGRERMRRAS